MSRAEPASADLRVLVDHVLGLVRRHGLDAQARALVAAPVAPTAPDGPAADDPGADDPGADAVARRHLPEALDLAAHEADEAVGRALATLAPALRWTRTVSYVRHPPHPGFLERYAHTTLLAAPGVTLGLLLLGPDASYPHHEHPADEVYVPLTPADWSSDLDAPLGRVGAGALLHHPPHRPHAMRTASTPLLALFLWTGDTATASRFSSR